MSASSPLFRPLLANWQARSPRERRLVRLAAAVVALALIASGLDWGLRERTRLSRAVPAAEAALARMQFEAAEITRLKNLPAPPQPTPAAVLAALKAAAQTRNLALQLETVPEGLRLQGTGSPAALFDFLAAAQSEWGVFPADLTLQSQHDRLSVAGLLVNHRGR